MKEVADPTNLRLVEAGDGVEGVEADEAALLGLAELAAEGVRQPLVGQQLVEAEQVANPLKHWFAGEIERLREPILHTSVLIRARG